jgi:hypothetical protein
MFVISHTHTHCTSTWALYNVSSYYNKFKLTPPPTYQHDYKDSAVEGHVEPIHIFATNSVDQLDMNKNMVLLRVPLPTRHFMSLSALKEIMCIASALYL